MTVYGDLVRLAEVAEPRGGADTLGYFTGPMVLAPPGEAENYTAAGPTLGVAGSVDHA